MPSKWCTRYFNAISAGDRAKAREVMFRCLESGVSARSIVMDMLVPAQHMLGDCWSKGKMSIAEEHRATSITKALLREVSARSSRSPLIQKRILIGVLEGELHSLSAEIISFLFWEAGWDVVSITDPTPIKTLVELVSLEKASLVALSLTNPRGEKALRSFCRAMVTANENCAIIAGGSATRGMKAVPGCVVIDDVNKALKIASELTGATPPAPKEDLDWLLAQVGLRLRGLRKIKGLSQAELGKSASLERTYISAVESGKQNLTLAALHRITSALGVSAGELVPR